MREKEERKKLVVFVLASNHFWKCFSINAGVWLCMENKFSKNYFQKLFSVDRVFWRLWPENGLKWKFSLQTIFGLTRKERKRSHPDHATNPEPRAFAPWTHEPISLSVWFWFFVWFWSTHEPIYVSVWFLFFTLSLISDFVVVVVVVWVVVFWWFSCCVVVGFVWVVVENNIFRMLPNTWKYFLEQFS